MKEFFNSIFSDDFIPKREPTDRKNNLVLYACILPLLIFIIYMDVVSHGVGLTWHFILVKTVLLLTVIVGFIFTYFEIAINVWPVVMAFYMLTYSVYGTFYIHFDYCLSFLELYLAISIFFRFSKKSYFLLMLWGGVLNFLTLEFMQEPTFVKEGMSIKPILFLLTCIIYYLSMVLFYFVTKKREDLAALHEKFALIGKQSSYVFHEIKKPVSRLMTSDAYVSNDIQQINNILLHIELMLNNPDGFRKSFTYFNLRNIFSKLESEFGDYLAEYKIEFNYPKDERIVFAHETLLFQVFKNLFVNAVEAIAENRNHEQKNSIAIEYGTYNDKIFIKFSNTGSMISRTDRENIFNPFYTTKKPSTNNGLGLSFCKNIIEGHEGKISLNITDSGPSFQILL
jgi:signal transduction histidine kinase